MALFRRKADPDAPRLGIYIHIPFCVRKCDYCDFTPFPVGTAGWMRTFMRWRCILRRARAAGGDLYGQYDLFRRRDPHIFWRRAAGPPASDRPKTVQRLQGL